MTCAYCNASLFLTSRGELFRQGYGGDNRRKCPSSPDGKHHEEETP